MEVKCKSMFTDQHLYITSIMVSGRQRVWFTVDVALPSEVARTACNDRLSSVRDLLSPPGRQFQADDGFVRPHYHGGLAGAHSLQCSTDA